MRQVRKQVGEEVVGKYTNVAVDMVIQHEPRRD